MPKKPKLISQQKQQSLKSPLKQTKHLKTLPETISQSIEDRLQKLSTETGSRIIGIKTCTCFNGYAHKIKVIKYADSSAWVACPMFGWYKDLNNAQLLGCKERKKRCTWFTA
jgi:hypothetical protein